MSLQSGELIRSAGTFGGGAGASPGGGSERLLWGAAIGLCALAGSFALWDPLDLDERTHVQRITQHATLGVAADLEAEFRSLLGSQALLARAWAGGSGLTREEWEHEAWLFVHNHPGTVMLEWLDPTRGAHFRLRSGTARSLGPAPDLMESNQARAIPAHTSEPFIAGVIPRPGGRALVRTLAAVSRAEASNARLLAYFDLDELLSRMLADHRELGYGIAVYEGQQLHFRTALASADDEAAWSQWAQLDLTGGAWRLRVWPTPELLAEMRSPLPELAVVLGCLLGVLIAVAAGLARAAQRRSLALGRARDEVELRVAERTEELARVNAVLRSEIRERSDAERALHGLSARLLKLQDDERRRIARELHDSTSQVLAAVGFGLERARRSLRRAPAADIEASLDESAQLIGQVTSEIRTLSFLLHPPMLHELGLEYALPWYAEGFSRRSGIAVRVEVARDLGRLPEDVETALYRVVQESLTNVHRHSGSHSAEISLSRSPEFVRLEVADQGRGLESGLARDSGAAAELGVGIPGMRERVRQLGGAFEVVGDQGGTLVRVVLPVAVPSAAMQGHGSVGTAA